MEMAKHKIFVTSKNRSIAYSKQYHDYPKSNLGVMFLGGFRSDMTGTKVSYLERWCVEQKYNFLKFDYSGHGKSSETFESGCITDWFDDTCEVFDKLTLGPQVLVGSSMGGWISFLLGKQRPNRIAALIGIATAPDFTENSMWANFDEANRSKLNIQGKIELESEYSSEPYTITKKLIEDGRSNLIMNSELHAPYSVRLLQGMEDTAVPFSTAIKLSEHIKNDDVEVTLVKGADHQFSSPHCLKILKKTLQEFL